MNRDVQGGDAFVGHEKAGIGNQSTGDRDTLALDQRQTASHFGDMLETASGEIHVGDGIRRDSEDSGLKLDICNPFRRVTWLPSGIRDRRNMR